MMIKRSGMTMFLSIMMTVVHAQEQAWISDNLRTSVNDAPGISAKFIGSVTAGMPITILNRSQDGDYLEIQTKDLQGWVSARNIMFNPSIHSQYADIKAQLDALNMHSDTQSQEQQNSAQIIAQLQSQMKDLRQREAQAQADLVAIKRISGNAVAIDERNRELQASVVDLEQQNLALRHQNSRLEDKINNKEIYIGGGLVVLGFILHWLSGLLRFNRKDSRFNDF